MATVAVTLITTGVASAEVTTPKARAVARRNGTVRVICYGFRGMGDRDLSTIEIERAAGDGPLEPLVTIPRPHRHQTYLDLPGAAGPYVYGCRVVSDTGTSAWSLPAFVTARPPATPRPTHTPKARATSDPLVVFEPTPLPSSTVLPLPTSTPTSVPPPPSPQPSPDESNAQPRLPAGMHECPTGSGAAVLALVNDARADAGLAALTPSAALTWSARSHSIVMAQQQVLTHDGWIDTIAASGYQITAMIAENIAVSYQTPTDVMDAWMASDGHRGHILSDVLRDVGVGCVVDENGTKWWTQDFGA